MTNLPENLYTCPQWRCALGVMKLKREQQYGVIDLFGISKMILGTHYHYCCDQCSHVVITDECLEHSALSFSPREVTAEEFMMSLSIPYLDACIMNTMLYGYRLRPDVIGIEKIGMFWYEVLKCKPGKGTHRTLVIYTEKQLADKLIPESSKPLIQVLGICISMYHLFMRRYVRLKEKERSNQPIN